MLHQSTYYDGDGKPARNTGSYEYLKQYGERMIATYGGAIEVRDAHGTLKLNIWNEDGDVKVWENVS